MSEKFNEVLYLSSGPSVANVVCVCPLNKMTYVKVCYRPAYLLLITLTMYSRLCSKVGSHRLFTCHKLQSAPKQCCDFVDDVVWDALVGDRSGPNSGSRLSCSLQPKAS